MEYLVGVVLAFAVSILATSVGFDRERVFYPAIVIVIASYYCLFAIMGGSDRALIVECLVLAFFILISIVGFKLNLWFVVAALFTHGIFDFFHGHFISNPGVPSWWPMFCLTYDVVAAGYLAWLLMRSRLNVKSL